MREAQQQTFTTHDDVQLFYRHWPGTPEPGAPRKAVLLFHRGHEHSGRIAHLVDELDLPDFDFFAWDARGHGLSPGARGDSPSFATSVRDVQTFCEHLSATYQIDEENLAVIAQSVGAVIVATWAHDYAPRIRCAGAGVSGIQGQALRALRPPGAGADAPVARQFFRQQLRQGALSQP